MKKSILFLGATLLTLSAFAKEVVNVYTHRHYDTDKELYKEFEKNTGITVNVVKAKAGELIKRLEIEGKNSPADVLVTVDVANLYRAKELGLFQPIKSKILAEAIPSNLIDKDNQWFALTKRARVVVYNRDVVKPKELSTYADLVNKKWKDRILIRSSNNKYNQSLVSSILTHEGEKETLKWLNGFVENFARKPKGSDRDQMRAVASGEGDIAIVNTYYVGKMLNSKKPADRAVAEKLGIFFPNQKTTGTHINVSGAGVTASSKNVDNATKFIEFLVSDRAQKMFAKANYEYPVKKGIKASSLVTSWGSFKEDDISLDIVGENNKKAVQLMDKAGWR